MKHERCKLSKMKWMEEQHEKKNERNNSGNIVYIIYLKNGEHSLHLTSFAVIRVWRASEMSKAVPPDVHESHREWATDRKEPIGQTNRRKRNRDRFKTKEIKNYWTRDSLAMICNIYFILGPHFNRNSIYNWML